MRYLVIPILLAALALPQVQSKPETEQSEILKFVPIETDDQEKENETLSHNQAAVRQMQPNAELKDGNLVCLEGDYAYQYLYAGDSVGLQLMNYTQNGNDARLECGWKIESPSYSTITVACYDWELRADDKLSVYMSYPNYRTIIYDDNNPLVSKTFNTNYLTIDFLYSRLEAQAPNLYCVASVQLPNPEGVPCRLNALRFRYLNYGENVTLIAPRYIQTGNTRRVECGWNVYGSSAYNVRVTCDQWSLRPVDKLYVYYYYGGGRLYKYTELKPLVAKTFPLNDYIFDFRFTRLVAEKPEIRCLVELV